MKQKRNYLKNSGITLIALVVTIVVLLILAGVSINAVFSENGIIKKAQDAQNKMNQAVENDEKKLNQLNSWIESVTGTDYTVTFCDYNGTELKKVEVAKGGTATYTGATPTRTADEDYNYTFSKWLTSKDGYIEAELTNVQSDMTVYALYTTQKVCFVAGTKVLSENGLINIEDIKKGMKVYSYNEETNQIELNEVKNTFINYVDYDMCKIYIKDEVIESTNKHPYYIKSKGWTEARYLQIGDILINSEGKEIEIENIETVKYDGNELKKVYNIEVNNNHNYFVGENKVLVHNWFTSQPARINDVYYDTLQEAFAAAKKGETIVLNASGKEGIVTLDVSTACGTSSETDNNITISEITIDMSGYTLEIASGNNVYLSNITISDSSNTAASIKISQGATLVMDKNTTIANTVTITNQN
mgnify:CR=1 FL=1